MNGVQLSFLQAAEDTDAAEVNLRSFVNAFGTGGAPREIKHNVVVFGVDGPGESLNKIRKVAPKKKAAPKKKSTKEK